MTQKSSDNPIGRLFVVSGPSGSGKSTLCRAAVAATDAVLSVSATTRPQSNTEIDGKDYFFLSQDEFKRKIEHNEFLEYAEVFGHYYGTPASAVHELLSQGRTVILEIDVQGAQQVFARFDEAIGVLVLPPGKDELRRRLCSRGRDDEATIERRLNKAQHEIDTARNDSHYTHHIVNDDLEEATEKLIKLIEVNGK